MKNRFIKFLPIAAAILLGTSCSKDDSNQAIDNVATPDPVQAEVVDTPVAKTITISGKASQSLSKVTTTDDVNFAFQGTEAFTFNDETNGVSGTIQFKNGASGDYDATITYTDAAKLTASTGFKAKHGTPPTAMSTAYTSLAAAVQNGYYETEFVVTGSEGAYSLKDKADNSNDIKVYVRCAFIKALCNKTAKLGGQDITVEEDKFYVIPSGVVMGSSSKETEDGTIYTVKEKKAVTSISISGGFSSSSSNPYVWGSETTDNKTLTATVLPGDATNKTVKWTSNAENVTVDENTGEITIKAPNTNTSTQTITITATAQDGSGVTGTYTLYLANYVQIAGAKWYTYDSQTSVTWTNRANGVPSGSAVPNNSQLEALINTSNTTISGNQIKSNNGSNAYITLTYGSYWSGETDGFGTAYYLIFNSGDRRVYGEYDSYRTCRVRLVRAQ